MLAVRDQDGDIHLMGTGETIVLTRQDDGRYTLLRMVPGEDDSVIIVQSTSWDVCRDAREAIWDALQGKANMRVDLASTVDVEAPVTKLRALPGGSR